MKICYLCPDLGIPLGGSKGAAAHVRGLVAALTQLQHEVMVLTPAPNVADLGVPVVGIPMPDIAGDLAVYGDPRVARAISHLWNNTSVESTITQAVGRNRPDLIYERYSPFGVAGSLVAKRLGIPHLLEVNAPLAWEGRQYRRQALSEAATALEHAAFEATSRIVAVSRELKDTLVRSGVAASKIFVVPNGVDVERFAPGGETYRNGIGDKFVVGFVGSLKAWHGIDVLADGFRSLAGDSRFHLLVVGDGPQGKILDKLSEELPGRVTRVGAVAHDDVPKYVRAMDVAVAPCPALERFYFSPLKVLEYMAAARPVVASRIGQLGELIQSGVTGVLVPPGDIPALTDAIQALACDEEYRCSLGAAAAAEVQRAHRWTDRAATIVSLAEGVK